MAVNPRIFFESQLALTFSAERVEVGSVGVGVGIGLALSLCWVVSDVEVLEGESEDSFVDVLVGELVGLLVRDATREAEVETVDVVLTPVVVVLTVAVLDGADSAF